MLRLTDSPERIPQVGSALIKKLQSIGINSIRDLLFYFPFRYDEFIENAVGNQLQEGSKVSIVGTLKSVENIFTRGGKRFTKALFLSDSAIVPVIWFNQPYLAKSLQIDSVMRLSGKVGNFGGVMTLISPMREKANAVEQDKSSLEEGNPVVEPIGVYSETAGLPSKRIRDMIVFAWKNLDEQIVEYLPLNLIESHKLLRIHEAIRVMHFPQTLLETEDARIRFSYEELFISQLRSALLRSQWREQQIAFRLDIPSALAKVNEVINKLPFVLTDAQKRVLQEMQQDMAGTVPMNRLVEGDVGSGKTVVAALAMYSAHVLGYKSLLMAPTQILASQHYATIKRVLEPFGVRIGLVVGGSKKVFEEADIYIGTHALLHQKEQLDKVALTVIDEQHRFGVEQRAVLRSKHGMTHVLSMTATPIPRTLALTLYGDLDLSLIDEMPEGRKQVKTRVVTASKREEANEWVRTFIKEKGEQVFIVCPFVEQSESSETVKSATVEYQRLRKEVYPNFKVGLLHGKLKASEKDEILQDFRDKKYQILVCTPVVEVGIDIPNASIIVIESAERFGLAQLHQFRGRVGRKGQQAFCLLFTSESKQEDSKRLKALEDTHSGIELAEIDLRYRGSGNLFGMEQSGRFFFKYADLFNVQLMQQARDDAKMLLSSDPELRGYPQLRDKTLEIFKKVDAN